MPRRALARRRRPSALLPGADREDANGWVRLAIPTGLGEARNALIVRAADALVAIGGAWGTLSEIALALKAGKPVIGLGTWELARAGRAVEGVAGDDDGGIRRVDEALARLESARIGDRCSAQTRATRRGRA